MRARWSTATRPRPTANTRPSTMPGPGTWPTPTDGSSLSRHARIKSVCDDRRGASEQDLGRAGLVGDLAGKGRHLLEIIARAQPRLRLQRRVERRRIVEGELRQ